MHNDRRDFISSVAGPCEQIYNRKRFFNLIQIGAEKEMAEKIAIISSSGERRRLEELVPAEVLDAARDDIQRAIPALAKDPYSSIQEHCRKIGFDNLAPIIWHKIANAQFESKRCTNFLGKPYEPNAIIKNDIEYILFQRKPGGYRQPTSATRLMSIIPENHQRSWFQQIWELNGASTKHHPAPYPLALAERLIRMFSFVGDTVLDPFMGTGTTNFAAGLWGRDSIGYEIEPTYFDQACGRIKALKETQLTLDSINSMEVKPSCVV